MGQVVFGIAHQFRQVGGAYFFFQMHFNVIHTHLHLLAEVGVGSALVNPLNKIIVHHQCQRIQVIRGLGILGRLYVAVPQRVGFLGRKPTLNGSAAHQRGKHDNAGLALAQSVIAAHGYARTDAHADGKRLFVVQVPRAHHLQKSLLCHPDLVAVMRGFLRGISGHCQCVTVDIAQRKMLAAQAVVQHQGVAVQNRTLQHGDAFQRLVQLHRPRDADLQSAVVLQPVFNAAQGNILIKYRSDDPCTF